MASFIPFVTFPTYAYSPFPFNFNQIEMVVHYMVIQSYGYYGPTCDLHPQNYLVLNIQ